MNTLRPLPRRAMLAGIGTGLATGPYRPAHAEQASVTLDFTDAEINRLPDGFTTGRTGQGPVGNWNIVNDPTAPGRRVLAQTSTDQTDYRFPLAIYDRISAANVEAWMRFRAVDGRGDRAGGIAVRLMDPDNYYVVRANALEDNVSFYRVVRGSREAIKSVGAKVASDAWHTLGLKADGDTFTIAYDGKVLFTTSDRWLSRVGKVALWTKADSVTQFAMLSITTTS